MAHTTTCPACGTTFRITAEQLLAHGGDVRCGRCTRIFNAHDTLTLDYPPANEVITPPAAAPEEPTKIPQEATDAPEVAAEGDATPQPELETPLEYASVPEAPVNQVATSAELAASESPAEMEAIPAPEEEWLLAGEEMAVASEPMPEETANAAEFLAEVDVTPPPEGGDSFAQADRLSGMAPSFFVQSQKSQDFEGEPPPTGLADTHEVSGPATAIELPTEPEVALEPEPAPETEFAVDAAREPEITAAPMPETAGAQIAEFPLDFPAPTHIEPAREETVTPPQASGEAVAAPELPVAFAALEQGETPPSRTTAPPRHNFRHLWQTGVALLVCALAAQNALYFRSELIATLPALKPAFEQACGWFGCQVSLPRDANLLSIEASSLEAGSGTPGLVTLNALLRNRAPHTQAFPLLELTLTDTQDALVARRIFQPAEYLPPQAAAQPGMLAEEEIDVRLNLDLGGIKAAGYRVYLFYPPNVS